ncbi:MAG: YidC/Oxa1 family membrane protein insertase [Oscillospiraceae bacterium]|nr:YidC/Oxa1 family membrane protein insertase [Oscillospiraceae bacterium]
MRTEAIGINIFRGISHGLGFVLNFIYGFVNNYGVALIIFTVLVKLILLPLSAKQQKSMVKMQQVQPKLKDLQDKYKNDPQKLQQEQMKLYKEHNVSPAGGCLPMLIQMPILFCLYQVISYPLTFMLQMSASESWALAMQYASDITSKNFNSAAQIIAATKSGLIDFELFKGFDLSLVPWQGITNPNVLWIIPIFAGLTTFLSSYITMNTSNNKREKKEDEKPKRILNPEDTKQGGNADQAQAMNKSMMYFMPFFTGWIAFSYSAALGFYWSLSNVLSILQQMYLNHKYGEKFKEEVKAIEDEKEKARKERRKLKQKRK